MPAPVSSLAPQRFTYPILVSYNSSGPTEFRAPALTSLPTPEPLTPVALWANVGQLVAGLYVGDMQGKWQYVLPIDVLNDSLLSARSISLYFNVSAAVTPPADTILYSNGVESSATAVPATSTAWWAAVTPLSGSGEAGYILPAASATTLGGVKVAVGGALAVDSSGDLTVTVPVAASPTALVGPAAVVGTALTFMRSDSAPAINLAANYTWTGTHTFNGQINIPGTVEADYFEAANEVMAPQLNTDAIQNLNASAMTITSNGALTVSGSTVTLQSSAATTIAATTTATLRGPTGVTVASTSGNVALTSTSGTITAQGNLVRTLATARLNAFLSSIPTTAGAIMWQWVVADTFVFNASTKNATRAVVSGTAPTGGTAVFGLAQNGTNFLNLNFAAGSQVATTSGGTTDITFNPGDVITLTAPATSYGIAGDFTMCLSNGAQQ